MAETLSSTDHLPDFVVCPVLLDILDRGTFKEKKVALWALEFRVFGGGRKVVSWHGYIPCDAKPVPGMEKWIARIPRPVLEDLHVVGNDEACPVTSHDGYGMVPVVLGGGWFLQALEPDDPRWRKPAELDDFDAALVRVNKWMQANEKPKGKQ